MFKLKKGQEAFEVVDGPMAGRKFTPGVEYAEVPPQEKQRFAEVKEPKAKPAPPPKKTTGKEAK